MLYNEYFWPNTLLKYHHIYRNCLVKKKTFIYISNLKPCDKYSEDDINDLKKALINSESVY